MKRFAVICTLGTAAIVLSACGGLELGKAKGVTPAGSAFDRQLYAEYLNLSQMEYDEADYTDADTFALRAMAAASGKAAAPEEITARALPADTVGGLTAARGRLVAALGRGAAEKMPQPAARAQAMYECWMQEQEENFQPADIAACRAGFEEAMAKLEVAPAPVASPAPAPRPLPGPFVVYFDFDEAVLTAEGQKVVSDAAKAIAARGPAEVVVVGYTDRSGAADYNLKLSRARADAVSAALKRAGVKTSIRLLVAGLGEGSPQVATADGVREGKNRRVTVELK